MATKTTTIDHIADFARVELDRLTSSAQLVVDGAISLLGKGSPRIDGLANNFHRFPSVARMLDRNNTSHFLFLFLSDSEVASKPADIREKLYVMNALRAVTELIQDLSSAIIRMEGAHSAHNLSEDDLSIIENVTGFCEALIEISKGVEARILSEVNSQQRMILTPAYVASAQRGTSGQFELAVGALLS